MTDWISSICETNCINTHYLRTGGNKPPLILLHGLMANGACWTDVAQALEDEYDVIMPDARGHGKSSVPHEGYQYETLANDVVDLIEALRLSFPIVMGHSMGGMTAALLASQKRKPLRGIILADPPFLSPEVQREVYEGDTIEQQRQFLSRSFDDILTDAKERQPHRSLDILKRVNQARYQTSLAPFEILKPPNPDYTQLVRNIDVESLLVIADKGIISEKMADELKSLNPKLEVGMITEAGHGLHYDQPEQFAAVVQSFLRSILH